MMQRVCDLYLIGTAYNSTSHRSQAASLKVEQHQQGSPFDPCVRGDHLALRPTILPTMWRVFTFRITLKGGGEALLPHPQWLASAEPRLHLGYSGVEYLKPHALQAVCPVNGATKAPLFADDELKQQLVDPTRRGEHRRGANRELGTLRPHHGLVMRPRRHSLIEDVLPVQSACERVVCLEVRGIREVRGGAV